MEKRTVVIGAGAAGLMAACFAARSDREIVLLERMSDGGRKILMSGGGRCNILPANEDENRYVTDSSRTLLHRILRTWPLREQIGFFRNEAGIPLYEEAGTGKLFPVSNRARDVRDSLRRLALRAGVRFYPRVTVTAATPGDGYWKVHTEHGAPIEAENVILATGGLSIPQSGSDGRGLEMLERLGLKIVPCYPALTPVFTDEKPFAKLAGVSVQAHRIVASDESRKAVSSGGFVFTHRGYSGPAVLDVSHVIARGSGGAELIVQWTTRDDTFWERRFGNPGTVLGAMRGELPERLAAALSERANVIATQSLSRLRRLDRQRIIRQLVACELTWKSHGGYGKAEVTGGGLALEEVHPHSMECRRFPGLFVCGELLDACGPIGGYNFQWAWVTGRAAGAGAAGHSARI